MEQNSDNRNITNSNGQAGPTQPRQDKSYEPNKSLKKLHRLIERYPHQPGSQHPNKDLHALVFLVSDWLVHEDYPVSRLVGELLSLEEAFQHGSVEELTRELEQYRTGAKVRVP